MRLSADRKSPHYRPEIVGKAMAVVDGMVVRGCVELDTDEGWADLLMTDDIGRPLVDGERWALQRLTGKISIEMQPCG